MRTHIEFELKPQIPHKGYTELPNPEGGTTQTRILGVDETHVYIHEDHVGSPQVLRKLKAEPWQEGPTKESAPITGQYKILREFTSNTWMLK